MKIFKYLNPKIIANINFLGDCSSCPSDSNACDITEQTSGDTRQIITTIKCTRGGQNVGEHQTSRTNPNPGVSFQRSFHRSQSSFSSGGGGGDAGFPSHFNLGSNGFGSNGQSLFSSGGFNNFPDINSFGSNFPSINSGGFGGGNRPANNPPPVVNNPAPAPTYPPQQPGFDDPPEVENLSPDDVQVVPARSKYNLNPF